MIAADLRSDVARLEDMIARARCIVPFTGAGISTECGIPDFRSPGGLWSRNKPILFDDFLTDPKMRDEAWRRRFAIDAVFSAAQPGRGHLAIASLYRAGKVPAVITQNIDNLHQVSGIPQDDIVELHGNTTYARCLDCAVRYEIPWARRQFEGNGGAAPVCAACGGAVKTATISFGEPMPQDAMRRAAELARESDLFLAIGSSLVVWPAAGIPVMAKQSGARLVIVNREPTEQDSIADLVIRHDIGEALSTFVVH